MVKFYDEYLNCFTDPLLRMTVLLLIIRTVFVATTGSSGYWTHELFAMVLFVVAVAINTLLWRKYRACRISASVSSVAPTTSVLESKLAYIGGLMVFSTYMFEAWRRCGFEFLGYFVFMRDFLQASMIAIGIIILISRSWVLPILLSTGRAGYVQSLVFRRSIVATIVAITTLAPLLRVLVPFTFIQLIWLWILIESLLVMQLIYTSEQTENMPYRLISVNKTVIVRTCCLTISALFFLSSKHIIEYFWVTWYEAVNFRPTSINFYGGFFAMILLWTLYCWCITSFSGNSKRPQPVKQQSMLLALVILLIVQVCVIWWGGNYFRTAGLSSTQLIIILSCTLFAWALDKLCSKF